MNRDTVIGFVLIALVLIGFSWWSQPSQEEIEAYQRQQDSIAEVQRAEEAKQKKAEVQRLAEADSLAA